jgi:hypothetical protein
MFRRLHVHRETPMVAGIDLARLLSNTIRKTIATFADQVPIKLLRQFATFLNPIPKKALRCKLRVAPGDPSKHMKRLANGRSSI